MNSPQHINPQFDYVAALAGAEIHLDDDEIRITKTGSERPSFGGLGQATSCDFLGSSFWRDDGVIRRTLIYDKQTCNPDLRAAINSVLEGYNNPFPDSSF